MIRMNCNHTNHIRTNRNSRRGYRHRQQHTGRPEHKQCPERNTAGTSCTAPIASRRCPGTAGILLPHSFQPRAGTQWPPPAHKQRRAGKRPWARPTACTRTTARKARRRARSSVPPSRTAGTRAPHRPALERRAGHRSSRWARPAQCRTDSPTAGRRRGFPWAPPALL
jgi:hypothetical protein